MAGGAAGGVARAEKEGRRPAMSWFGRLLWRTFLSIVALFMLVVIIPGGYWAWTTIEDRRGERSVSTTREWPPTEILMSVGKDRKERAQALKASVKTRCAEGVLYYIVTIKKSDLAKADEDFEDATTAPLMSSGAAVYAGSLAVASIALLCCRA